MSEFPVAEEELVRFLRGDVVPAISLRQRILAASGEARSRQLRRARLRCGSLRVLMSLGLLWGGMQVQWRVAPISGDAGEMSVSSRVAGSTSVLHDPLQRATSVTVIEIPSGSADSRDPVEWEMAKSHLELRDQQSALISRYF